ncbi:hypothetical protein UFOVP146_70 [uncultured Caudovirales phage]|jgi:hypothetical protein|uniref:Uncharacterized protein n=1 Tax=uncultured Caudovirales phage TaxID=2100421 RepID=A0A6J7VPK5_9CAUD|nr:hypothetical protein UFOVP146_70 [uncultured Caudovirales phage]
MASYIDLEQLIVMFKSTYRNSYLRGDEIAKILEVRFGQQDQKSAAYARNRQGSGLLSDGLPED